MRKQGLGADFGGWNLGTSLKRDAFNKLYAEKGEVLRIVAMYMHEQLNLKLKKDAEETVNYQKQELTTQQIACLRLLAEGKRIQQIADILNIKPITVDYHNKACAHKFKRNNKRAGNRKSNYKRYCYIGVTGQKVFRNRGIIPQHCHKI